LLQLLLGDVVPVAGVVWLGVEVTQGALEGTNLRVPLHTPEVLAFVRAFETYVPQEAFVASASVRENVPLRYLEQGEAPGVSEDAAIVKSLERASLDLDERTFPDGLATELGERGVNLSGGQKQRLSLSRSVFAGVNVILLDDPMSAVDKDTERVLVERLFDEAWKDGFRTILWATHRLDYVDRAVCVVDLDALADAQGGEA
jgi:ABC-type multidrug transport system fused ATPase/permease subunit